jgi:hypothetical protein
MDRQNMCFLGLECQRGVGIFGRIGKIGKEEERQ